MLLRLKDIWLEFGDQPLLLGAQFNIDRGERVCLIGRNGAGKTSLLKIVAGAIQPDQGERIESPHLGVAALDQALPSDLDKTVQELVEEGMAPVRALVAEHERLSQSPSSAKQMAELAALEARIESADGWQAERRVQRVCSELDLPPDKRLSALSGGWRRRAALGRALVSQPDLLLLDEPTNHLDLSTIEWLERHVRHYPGAVIFVTHDRAFVEALATRIVEIDHGHLTSWPGTYASFLREKEHALLAQQRAEERFDKRLAEEEVWVRQGLKARRTRNEGRVRALEAMRRERAKRRSRQGQVRMSIDEADNSGRRVLRAKNVTYGYSDEPLISGFSYQVMRGDRIGLIGNNGVGKSTLLKLFLGELAPSSGTIKLGTNLEIGYFDQLRRGLDPEMTVVDVIGDGREYVSIGGKQRHVVGYLRGFLFSPKRARAPVKALSGGEKNRLILAALFARPTNLLILDEPTNDLDMETLEVLEERLADYAGTLIVVSHDRKFLDNVVTSVLVFESGGAIVEYVGGYSDWARRGKTLEVVDDPNAKRTREGESQRRSKAPTKLGYMQQRELEALPDSIDAIEAEIVALESEVSAPEFFSQSYDVTKPVLDAIAAKTEERDRLVERWSELEKLKAELER